jgi:NitT/TauT family transport system permease protein
MFWDRIRVKGLVRNQSVAIFGFILLVGVWWGFVEAFHIRPYILPSPIDVAFSFWRGITAPVNSRSSMIYHLAITFRAAGLGFLFGGSVGVLFGIAAASSRFINRVLSPYVFALQSLPKIAIAPLMMIWFGFGLTTKTILASFLVFFPMFVNTYTGISVVDRNYLRLFKALGANPIQIMFRLRIPNALVLIFAGLEIAVVQAILGALVGEFISANEGIGILLLQYRSVNNTVAMFAALILLALSGVILHKGIQLLKSRIIFWIPAIDEKGGKIDSLIKEV